MLTGEILTKRESCQVGENSKNPKLKDRRGIMKNLGKKFLSLCLGLLIVSLTFGFLSSPRSTEAKEVKEVVIAKQFGLTFFPLIIMVEHQLLEKHAKARGLDVRVKRATFGGGAAMNDALLAGRLSFASGGVGPLVKIWGKTKPVKKIEVKGVAGLGLSPYWFMTRDPNLKSVKDIGPKHKIALPSVKVSIQAVLLQMAAASAFGQNNYERLDRFTVSMKHPEAAAALLSGRGEINAHFANAPYSFRELRDPKLHKAFTSYDILGGPHTAVAVYTTAKFRKKNPGIYAAFVAALEEATDLINIDPRGAAETYVRSTKSKLSPDFIYEVITHSDFVWTTVPVKIKKFSDFLYKTGSIKVKAKSWKDLFFPEIHGKPGS
jgi:NitT/TauT family transport system substrate-binding protein